MAEEYWLAEVDASGIVLKDGPHSSEEGAQKAYYLYKCLGFKKDCGYSIAKVEMLPVSEETQNVNEEAVRQCNAMLGIRR